ncbi:MAG: 50S ribosomal protein L22 [Candidatus Woesearchaeota archaeon]
MKEDNKAMAKGIGVTVSTKQSIEICNFIRGKKVSVAKEMLKKVIAKKLAVPMKRFNRDTGHKKGIGPGRFPMKAASEILKLLKSAESNAINLGLNTDVLNISSIMANKGEGQWRYGRQKRRKMKRSNISILVEEAEVKSAVKKAGDKQPEKKEEATVEKPKKEVVPEKPAAKEKKQVAKKEESKQPEKKAEATKESKAAVEEKTKTPKEEKK